MTTPRPPFVAGTLVALLLGAVGASGCGDPGTSPSPGATPSAPGSPSAPVASCAAPATFYGCAYTLQGVSLTGQVFELTPTGRVGIADAWVYCEACGLQTHSWAQADSNGFYTFSGDVASGGGVWLASGFLTMIGVEHAGYQDPPGLPALRGPMFGIPTGPGWREVLIDGDTRFDIQLARQ